MKKTIIILLVLFIPLFVSYAGYESTVLTLPSAAILHERLIAKQIFIQSIHYFIAQTRIVKMLSDSEKSVTDVVNVIDTCIEEYKNHLSSQPTVEHNVENNKRQIFEAILCDWPDILAQINKESVECS